MKSRDRTVIGVVVVVIVAIAGYFLVVAPKHHQASQLQGQIAEAQNELSQVEAEVQSGLRAQSQYATYSSQLKSIQTAVPSDERIPSLITELQSAATRNRVAFEEVSTSASTASSSSDSTSSSSAATNSSTFPSQTFSLSFTGNYFAVARMLGTLAGFVSSDNTRFHATGRLITISTLTLSPSGGAASEAGNGSVSAAVTAIDYDVPSALAPVVSGSSSSTSAGSPAAYVTH